MNKKEIIPAVNFHLWEPCNMRCKFCFATFQDVKRDILPKGHLPKKQAIQIIKKIANYGFEKITFAGGEPTLCPWLPDLIKVAKEQGLTTMLVSNGSKLTDCFLETNIESLDWITLSVDSVKDSNNLKIGRAVNNKNVLSKEYYENLILKIHKNNYGLKINTVVNKLNYNENLVDFINKSSPKRWKVLQVLPVLGQNDKKIDDLSITNKQFEFFVKNHSSINSMIPESNIEMKGSYVMIDPAGRFFDNSEGKHNYSDPILEIGIEKAYSQVNYSFKKFVDRKGLYDFKRDLD